MSGQDFEKANELLNFPKLVSLLNADEFIARYIERKADKRLAIEELDNLIALVQNHLLSLSIHIKQKYLVVAEHTERHSNTGYYTKQEIANLFRVSVRTVTNWIVDGLKCEEIRGIKRVSIAALKDFVKNNKKKKFAWRSVNYQTQRIVIE